jgi:hypothetical protein
VSLYPAGGGLGGGAAGARVMISRTLSCVTNARPYLLGTVLKKMSQSPVECGPAGDVYRGLPLPLAHVESVAKFAKQSHKPESFDHVIVSRGTLLGTVLNMFEEALFEGCFAAYALFHVPPMEWSMYAVKYSSDHMPVCAAWTF